MIPYSRGGDCVRRLIQWKRKSYSFVSGSTYRMMSVQVSGECASASMAACKTAAVRESLRLVGRNSSAFGTPAAGDNALRGIVRVPQSVWEPPGGYVAADQCVSWYTQLFVAQALLIFERELTRSGSGGAHSPTHVYSSWNGTDSQNTF